MPSPGKQTKKLSIYFSCTKTFDFSRHHLELGYHNSIALIILLFVFIIVWRVAADDSEQLSGTSLLPRVYSGEFVNAEAASEEAVAGVRSRAA